MLARFGRVYVMEMDAFARNYAIKRGHGLVSPGYLPGNIPFADRNFDLVVLLDVLEHLEDDAASLCGLRARLKSDGALLVTVPAWRFMWSHHDEIHHHKRRYSIRSLCTVVRNAGYDIRYITYFNFWLFPVIATMRILQRLVGSNDADDLVLPSKTINRMLSALFASESHLIGRISLPVGVSLLLVAKNRRSNSLPQSSTMDP
jgi:SAM-dependent methyltransferase